MTSALSIWSSLFAPIYESGQLVPYYQPIAALRLSNRTIDSFDSATGTNQVTADLSMNGTAQKTHTDSHVALLSITSAPASSASSAATEIELRMTRNGTG